jgi:dephospho-CoA kinase
MLKVGLTGGIGSGKSTVSSIFQVLGIPVFNADTSARDLMQNDITLRERIINLLGPMAYANNQLDRRFIAEKVFSNPTLLNQLNSMVHPATIIAAESWMNQQQSPYVVKEAALMFESTSAFGLDLVVGVSAPLEIRIDRVMRRDGLSRQQVLDRMNRQINENIKMKLCDYVIINDEIKPLLPQVIKMHKLFLTFVKAGS